MHLETAAEQYQILFLLTVSISPKLTAAGCFLLSAGRYLTTRKAMDIYLLSLLHTYSCPLRAMNSAVVQLRKTKLVPVC